MADRNPFFSRASSVLFALNGLFAQSVLLAPSVLFATAALCVGLASCTVESVAYISGRGTDPNKIRILDWNAQTFFDDEECGAEFDEFRGSRTEWDSERYSVRLDRLAEVLLLSGSLAGMGPERAPEIVVLEEIENQKVLRDVCARLPATASYESAIFVPQPPGGSFGSAILSRYPVISVRSHTPYSPDTPLRPMIEARFDTPGGPFVVFAVHWKSKVGGGGDAELRAAQERLLSERIEALKAESPLLPFVACGDFNCGPDESELIASLPGFWARFDASGVTGCAGTEDGVGEPNGSYWYDGAWERIDHVLWPDALEFPDGLETPNSDDSPKLAPYRVTRAILPAGPPLLDSSGHPARYAIYNGRGYSDHLPLLVELTRNN